METQQSRQEHRKSLAQHLAVPQLLTPEEHIEDTFVSKAPAQTQQFHATVPSPPASPEFQSFSTEAAFERSDSLLYPENTSANDLDAQRPLFDGSQRFDTPEPPESSATTSAGSVASPSSLHDSPLSTHHDISTKPRSESQSSTQAVPVGPVQLLKYYGLDYYRFCRMQCEEYQRQKMETRKLPPPTSSRRAGRDGYTQKVISSLGRPYRVEKSVATGQFQTKARASRVTAAKAPARSVTPSVASFRHESSTKRNRRQITPADAPSGGALMNTVQPKPRTRAAPTKKIDDATDWRQIPDFCPPISTLDDSSRQLNAHWTNNNELNLMDDPEKGELHPQELKLAATLRLKCNSYLANKRRIFRGKVEALREGKDFNKTSAQNVTNIDVNKASRLWTAFDQAGWFDQELFKAYL